MTKYNLRKFKTTNPNNRMMRVDKSFEIFKGTPGYDHPRDLISGVQAVETRLADFDKVKEQQAKKAVLKRQGTLRAIETKLDNAVDESKDQGIKISNDKHKTARSLENIMKPRQNGHDEGLLLPPVKYGAEICTLLRLAEIESQKKKKHIPRNISVTKKNSKLKYAGDTTGMMVRQLATELRQGTDDSEATRRKLYRIVQKCQREIAYENPEKGKRTAEEANEEIRFILKRSKQPISDEQFIKSKETEKDMIFNNKISTLILIGNQTALYGNIIESLKTKQQKKNHAEFSKSRYTKERSILTKASENIKNSSSRLQVMNLRLGNMNKFKNLHTTGSYEGASSNRSGFISGSELVSTKVGPRTDRQNAVAKIQEEIQLMNKEAEANKIGRAHV